MKAVICVLLVLALPAAALAKKKQGSGRKSWPTPALGRSASGQPEVLFTFDDGPSGALTAEILDVLAERRVHAIFFLVGNRVSGGKATAEVVEACDPLGRVRLRGELWKARAQQLIGRMLDEGHAVGNHTQNHRDLCLASQIKNVDKEIDDSQALIEQATAMNIVLFRTPFGVRCARLEEALVARHLEHIHWDVDPQEWKTHNAETTQHRIVAQISRLRDGERAVILAHDIHPETIRAIPAVLNWIDEENNRRRAAGKKEIRIIDPAEIALEKLAPGMAPATGDAAAAVAHFGDALLRRLVFPLAGVAAVQL